MVKFRTDAVANALVDMAAEVIFPDPRGTQHQPTEENEENLPHRDPQPSQGAPTSRQTEPNPTTPRIEESDGIPAQEQTSMVSEPELSRSPRSLPSAQPAEAQTEEATRLPIDHQASATTQSQISRHSPDSLSPPISPKFLVNNKGAQSVVAGNVEKIGNIDLSRKLSTR
jgi:hypothetical protein